MFKTSPQDIKEWIDLRDVVAHFWGKPRFQSHSYDKHFAQWRNDGSNPSFVVYRDRYQDYGGDADTGDVFSFLERELNLSFKDALDWARHFAGLGDGEQIIWKHKKPHPTKKQVTTAQEPTPSTDWQTAASAALTETQVYLWSDQPDAKLALAYLVDVRGLHPETIRDYGFGYNPRWHRIGWQNPTTGKAAYLPPGITIPWWHNGRLVALRVRCRVGNLAEALHIPADTHRDGSELPKYLSLAGSKQAGAVYNIDNLKAGSHVVIVEGEFDAALADETLLYRENPSPEYAAPYVVITSGSATNRFDESSLKRLQEAASITLMLDNDDAGQDAQKQIIRQLKHPDIRVAHLNQSKDVTEFVTDTENDGDLHQVIADAARLPWWIDGVPDAIRTALLTYFRDATAPVIEMLNTALERRLINPDGFTVSDLLAAGDTLGYCLNHMTVRRVLLELEDYFFTKCDTKVPSQAVSPFVKNKRRGRMAVVYRLLPLERVHESILAWAIPRIYEKHHPVNEDDGIVAVPTAAMLCGLGFSVDWAQELAEKLNQAYRRVYAEQDQAQEAAQRAAYRALARLRDRLNDTTSTPLPQNWMITNGTSYRAAYLRAVHDPDERLSRRRIAILLGVNISRVDKFVVAAGLMRATSQGEFEMAELRSAYNISGQIKQGAREVQGYPRSFVSVSDDGAVLESSYYGDESLPLIACEIGKGNKVRVKYQVANHFVAVTDGQPEALHEKATSRDAQVAKTPEKQSRRRDAKTPFDKVKCHYGPQYNVDWLRLQLLLALIRMGRLDYRLTNDEPLIFDMLTGEVYQALGAVDLLRLLLPDETLPDDPAQVLGIIGKMVLG